MSIGPRWIAISLVTLGCVVGPGELEPATNIAEPEPAVAISSPPPVGRWAPRNDSPDVCAWRGAEFALDDFEVLPATNIDALCNRYSSCRWYVDVAAGQPRFRLEQPSRPWPLPFTVPIDSATGTNGRGMAHEVDDGWLVAFDHGEWGSAVWWHSAEGSVRKLLGSDALVEFFTLGGEIWAPAAKDFRAGEGYMLRFDRDEAEGWRAVAGPDLLHEVPQIAVVDGDKLLIVSFRGVEEVDALGRVTVLAEVDLWNHGQVISPSSLARTRAGTILIGSGVGVVRLTPDGEGYLEDWLVPPACREASIDVEELRCQCVGLGEARETTGLLEQRE
jgi:hypothetical protein